MVSDASRSEGGGYEHTMHVCIIESAVVWAYLSENVVSKQRPLWGITKGGSTKDAGC